MKRIKVLSILALLLTITSCDSFKASVEESEIPSEVFSEVSNESKDSSSSELVSLSLESILKNSINNLQYSEEGLFDFEGDISEYSQVELIDANKYQIIYNSGDEIDTWYYEQLEDSVNFYYGNENYEWNYTNISQISWDSVYSDYHSSFTDPSTFNLKDSSFDLIDGVFVCKQDKVNEVGNKIMSADDLGADSLSYSAISIKTNQTYVEEITLQFAGEAFSLPFVGKITLSYSNINSTEVSLPNAIEVSNKPDYIDPSLADRLTNQQANVLNAILNANYNSYTCHYSSIESDGYSEMYETLLYEDGKCDYYWDITSYYGFIHDTYQLYSKQVGENYLLYTMDDDNVVSTSLLSYDDYYDYSPYGCLPSELGYLITDFGYYDGVYLFTVNGLNELNAYINSSDYEVTSIEIHVNDDNSIDYIREIYTFAATEDYDEYFETVTYKYSNINSTTVTLPSEGNALVSANEDQISAFKKATNLSYSDVTIYDSIDGTTYYFLGNEIVSLFYDYDDSIAMCSYKQENGKYYALSAKDTYEELPLVSDLDNEIYGVDYLLPFVNFDAIDTTLLQYNVFSKEYTLSGDVNWDEIIFYYSCSFEILSANFVINSDGNLLYINITFIYDDEEYEGYGLEYYDYNNTVLPY